MLRTSPASVLVPLLLGALAPLVLAESYVPPAQVRVHYAGSADPAMHAVHDAEGHIVARGRGWFDAILPQDVARTVMGTLPLAEGDRLELVSENLDTQLERFRGRADVGVYHTVAEVEAEIAALVAARPDLISSEVLAETAEGRAVRAVRISSKGDEANLPTFLICGMHHAREWISVEVPMGLIHTLVEGYDTDPEIRELVDSREVWVVPVLNPDGLEYSQTKKRMWRKNRRPTENGNIGVDLNRNWGYQWGGVGASPSPGSDTYRGPEAFSEVELQGLRDLALREQPVASLSFHSYSELVLWPWSYQRDAGPDHEVLALHAREMAKFNGYKPMQSAGLYPSSGDFDDWFYGNLGALSYTFELGKQFVPDEDEVPGIVADNLGALRYFLKHCADAIPLLTHAPLPATTDAQGPYPVELKLSPRHQGQDPVQAAVVRFSTAAGAAGQVALTPGAGGRYLADLPGDGYGTAEYHFEVTEVGGKQHRYPAAGEFTFPVVEALYLLVDDDDGKAYQGAYEAALRASGTPFSVRSSDGLTEADLLGASGVIWFCGDDAGTSLTRPERELLGAYLGAGGELLLFGQDIGYAIQNEPFYTEQLRARFVKDKAKGSALAGVAGSFLEDVEFTINGGDGVAQRFAEAVEPREGAERLLTYQGSDDDGAVAVTAGYKAAYFGIGLEGIDGAESRAQVLSKALAWLEADGTERRLRRAERLRVVGGDAANLARLEARVLEDARALDLDADRGALRRLTQLATGDLRRHLVRMHRQPSH